jgi:uncharacterized protein (DUF433 family)
MVLTIHAEPQPLRLDSDGTLRVGGTRVSLDVMLAHYREGATVDEIAERFPVLIPADVHAALAYYLRHRAEIDDYLAEQDRQAEEGLRALGDRHHTWSSEQERLLRRVSGTTGNATLPGG